MDIWQASLCVVSPLTRERSLAYASQERYLYVMAGGVYKIHYYFISLLLITMLCVLVYRVGRGLRAGGPGWTKPLRLQGMAVAVLLGLCVFANTTAFFRQAQSIQTPVAALLTSLFFIMLGASVGVYTGSAFLSRSRGSGLILPVVLAVAAAGLLYIGEAVMMGGLYRMGTGWFFDGLPGVLLAPADGCVIVLAGVAAWLILRAARTSANWPGKRTFIVTLVICALIAAGGVGFSVQSGDIPENIAIEGDVLGRYKFYDCLYMNPLSSFMAVKGHMPFIYTLDEDSLHIYHTETRATEVFKAEYEKSPMDVDEFINSFDILFESSPILPMSQYKERWFLGAFTGDREQYGLYQMDGVLWLVRIHNGRLWSIYTLQKTAGTPSGSP